MIRISYILPIYNVAQYLPDCLDSLYAQDIPESDFEVVCVIDGSPDNSKDILINYKNKKHDNLVIIEQENMGVGKARNTGFDAAQGKYIWFVDPDDMISANCIGTILNLMDENNADVFEMEFRPCEENSHNYQPVEGVAIDGYNRFGSAGSGWLAVCLSSYLRNNEIRWNEELSYGEDYLWAFQVKYRKNKSIFTKAPIYIYRQRENSAMHMKTDRAKSEKHISDLIKLNRIYEEEYIRCQNENLSESALLNIRQRQHLCIESALLGLLKLKLSKAELRTKLDSLVDRGVYPYPFMLWRFLDKNKTTPLKVQLFCFLFPLRSYYESVCALYRTIKRS